MNSERLRIKLFDGRAPDKRILPRYYSRWERGEGGCSKSLPVWEMLVLTSEAFVQLLVIISPLQNRVKLPFPN